MRIVRIGDIEIVLPLMYGQCIYILIYQCQQVKKTLQIPSLRGACDEAIQSIESVALATTNMKSIIKGTWIASHGSQ